MGRIYTNVFGRTADAEGLQNWVNQLDASATTGINRGNIMNKMIETATSNPENGDGLRLNNQAKFAVKSVLDGIATETATAQLNSITAEQSSYEAAYPGGGEEPTPEPEGQTFTLTAGTDNADTFNAGLSQNPWAGGVSNSLSSADVLDGKGGTDSLHAELVPEFFGVTGDNQMDVQPRTSDIENVTFEAREVNAGANSTVTVDAKYMTGVEKIGSKFSDGDLVIENLTTLTDNGTIRNTADMTITMDHTDNFNSDSDASDLTVYFDEDYLVTGESTSGATLTVRMLNAVQNEAGNNPVEGFSSIAFKVGDEDVLVDITSVANDPAQDFTTAYTAIVALINAQLNTQGITTVTATAPALEDAVFSIPVAGFTTGDDAGDYYPIILTNTGAEALTGVEIGQSALSYDTDMNGSFSTVAPETNDEPLSVQVELEKVGREGEGGNLVIGGKSQDADEGEGIPIFNIDVLGDASKPSNLGTIRSTNGALDVVNIATADTTLESFASLTVRGESDFDFDGSALPVDGSEDYTPFGGALTTLNAVEFLGDLTIGNEVRADDIASFTATGGGVVTLYINNDATANTVTTGTAGDYLNITDAGTLTVNSAGGDDELIIQVGGATITSNQINAGSGNDELTITGTTATVDMGAGDDIVYQNSVALDVSGGTGNDVIYAENTGEKAQLVFATSALSYATAASDGTPAAVIGDGVEFLHNARVQVILSVDGNAAGALTNAFESELVTITASEGYLTTQADVNTALVSAINDNDVLNKIFEADVDANGDFIVKYLVDGTQVDASMDIEFYEAATALAGSLAQNIQDEFEDTYNDSGFFADAPTTAAAQQTAAVAAANTEADNIALDTAASAVYTIDMAGLVLGFDAGNAGANDTIEFGGVTVYTATANNQDETDVSAAIDGGTVTIDGITYDIAETGGVGSGIVTLTSQVVVANPSALIVSVTNTDTTGADAVAPTTTVFTATAGADVAMAGSDSSGNGNTNIINGDAGDDVLVLDSNDAEADIVVYDALAQGNDTIVHFATGVDQIDFTSFLTNTLSASGSPESRVDLGNTADTDLDFVANEITLLGFEGGFGFEADGYEWSDLSISMIETFLNTAGNGVTTTNTTSAGAEVYETLATGVLVIENDTADDENNDGEYAAYAITFTEGDAVDGVAKDFNVQLIGTFDLGDNHLVATTDFTL